MLDMKALEAALAPIEELGQDTLTFKAGEHTITLRVLLPDEETEVQKYAREAFVDGKDSEDQATMMEYLDRFKIAILSHAIVVVDTLDLRGADKIATGEVLPNGNPVHVFKSQAMRTLLAKWTRPVLIATFSQYGKLMERIEEKTEKSIEFDPSDLSAEIERVERRLLQLKETQARGKADNPVANQVKAVSQLENATQEQNRRIIRSGDPVARTEFVEEVVPVPEKKSVPEPQPQVQSQVSEAPPEPRRPIIPTRAAPPLPVAAVVPEPPPPAPRQEEPSIYDSIADPTEDSIAAEERRLSEARGKALQASKEARMQEAVGGGIHSRRQPPHRAAANTSDALVDTGLGSITPSRLPPGAPEGTEAYRLPPQTLSSRSAQPRGHTVSVDTVPKVATNSKFVPPKR